MHTRIREFNFSDSRALEFVDILRNGSYNDLLELYRYYKGFCKTNTADFVQRVVVDFFETYCVQLAGYRPQINSYDRYSLFPWNDVLPRYEYRSNNVNVMNKYNQYNKYTEYFNNNNSSNNSNSNNNSTDVLQTLSVDDYVLPTVTTEHFTDTWDNDFNNNNSSSQKVSKIYACNTGLSGIPTVFESKLYFRDDKFHTDIRAEPYVACQLVAQLIHCFLEMLHERIASKFNGTENPWNFRLYNLMNTKNRVSMDKSKNTVMMSLKLKYDDSNDRFIKTESITDQNMFLILEDMHRSERFVAMFPVGYSWNGGVGEKSSTDSGQHAVTLVIVKQDKHIILFVLDPNGLQSSDVNNSRECEVMNFFNQLLIDEMIEEIEMVSDEYNVTVETEINLNPHNINFGGHPYQQDGYCLLISFFFIHVLYNNITIHNRRVFYEITDCERVVQYIKDTMWFIFDLINTSPFSIEEFFFNYSINIFQFYLSTNSVEEYFQVYNLETTVQRVNAEFTNQPKLRHHFQRVTNGNVLSLYMAIILEGLECLPSVIGVPKPGIPNYKELLNTKNYSCIQFYTPYRNLKKISMQELVSWFYGDRTAKFEKKQNIDGVSIKNENTNLQSFIPNPSLVLLNLKRVVDEIRSGMLINDYSIMTPSIIDYDPIPQDQCVNMQKQYFARLNNFEFH